MLEGKIKVIPSGIDLSPIEKIIQKYKEDVTDLINNPSNNIFVSDLARLEFISALCRRYRNKEIDDQELNEAISGFDEKYSYFHVEPLKINLKKGAVAFCALVNKEPIKELKR